MQHKTLVIPKEIDPPKFFSKISIDKSTGCWNWRACRLKKGYGKYKKYLSHRVSYSIFNNDINPSLVIDHICRNTSCVNPDHLRQVSMKTNVTENSNSVSAINRNKNKCINGHAFTLKNTILKKNGRGCRICTNIKQNQWAKMKRKQDRLSRVIEVKTYCKNGHKVTPENIKKIRNSNSCYRCYLDRAKRYYDKKTKKL